MNMSIPIDRLIRTRRKTIALVIERDGSLTVRAPMKMTEARIHDFVGRHADWVIKHQEQARTSPLPGSKRYIEGETFLFLGQSYPLAIVSHQRLALTFDNNAFLLAVSALPKAEQVFTRWYKTQAARVLSERILLLSTKYDLPFGKIRITSARTRWGSCSSRGTISFTWRLVMAPAEVVDYVVIHELVHMKIKNHSKTFWGRVEAIYPGYKKNILWLKKNGRYLTL